MRRSKHYWGERERERERFHDALFHGTESARREPREPPRGMHPPRRVSLAPARSTPPSLRDSPSSSLQHRKSFHRVVLRVKCVEIEGRKKTKAIARDAPGAGFGANTPVSLSNIHDLGAFKRFKCFFGPRTMLRCLLLLLLRALFVLGSFSFFFFFLCLELIKRSRKVPTKNNNKKKVSQSSGQQHLLVVVVVVCLWCRCLRVSGGGRYPPPPPPPRRFRRRDGDKKEKEHDEQRIKVIADKNRRPCFHHRRLHRRRAMEDATTRKKRRKTRIKRGKMTRRCRLNRRLCSRRFEKSTSTSSIRRR